jgi:hypothetical protein
VSEVIGPNESICAFLGVHSSPCGFGGLSQRERDITACNSNGDNLWVPKTSFGAPKGRCTRRNVGICGATYVPHSVAPAVRRVPDGDLEILISIPIGAFGTRRVGTAVAMS